MGCQFTVFHVVLYQPEIPPNAGNVIRMCANSGCRLHLIEPLGFSLDTKALRRAALDYRQLSGVATHADWAVFLERMPKTRIFAFSTKHRRLYTDVAYQADDTLVFGPETRGLPETVRSAIPEQQRLCVPMRPGNRSLNLANTVAVVVYEAWRQNGFSGAG